MPHWRVENVQYPAGLRFAIGECTDLWPDAVYRWLTSSRETLMLVGAF